MIADTAYDSDDFRAQLAKQGSVAVIPSHPSRAQAIVHDKHLYKERQAVECFINKIKHFRCIASRYECPQGRRSGKTARNFLAHDPPLQPHGLVALMSTEPSCLPAPTLAASVPPQSTA